MKVTASTFRFTALVICFSFISQNTFAQSTQYAQGESSTSIFTKNQKFDNEGVELYESNLEMKSMKKLGMGLAVGGITGLVGLNAEINVQPEDVVFLGLGTGKGFNTFNFGYKRNFEGYYMSPYTKVGFSKWFDSSNSGAGSARSSDVLRRVLSEDQIQSNDFDVNFIVGGAGLEYNQLEGELSGINFFGELMVMADTSTFNFLPTGSVGITYFY